MNTAETMNGAETNLKLENVALEPAAKELRAIHLFVSDDTTRPHLAHAWRYESDGGLTIVATDSHTLCVRIAGTHRRMTLGDIARLPVKMIAEDGPAGDPKGVRPPAWDHVCHAPKSGKTADRYSVNPVYFARLGDVERAAGARAAEDYKPSPRQSKKDIARKRVFLRGRAYTTLQIGTNPLDGWRWLLETDAARWEGVLMPRRTS